MNGKILASDYRESMIMVYYKKVNHESFHVRQSVSIRGCVNWSGSWLVGRLVGRLCDNSHGVRDGLPGLVFFFFQKERACKILLKSLLQSLLLTNNSRKSVTWSAVPNTP